MVLKGNTKLTYFCEYQRTLYAKRKARGLCPHCGVRAPYPGYVSCLECRKRHRGYAQRFNARQREMKRQGISIVRCACRKRALILCIQCQTPLCDRCYDLGEGHCQACRDQPHTAMP